MYTEGYQYYRIKIPNLSQHHIHKIIELDGVRRFLYNFGIDYCESLKAQGKGVPSFNVFCKILTKLRHSEDYKWLNKYNVTTERYALKDLVSAYAKFFKKINRYPKYKSKKRNSISCSIREDRFRITHDGQYAFIPGISDSINDLIFLGNHKIPHTKYTDYDNIRIKFDGVDFWLSLSIKLRTPLYSDNRIYLSGEPLGVDVGVRTTATLSDGTKFDFQDKKYIDRLIRKRNHIFSSIKRNQNKRLKISKRTRTKYDDIPISKNQQKRERQFRSICNRIRNITKTYNHYVSRQIANKQPAFIVVETLKVGDMERKNPFVASYIHRTSMFQLTEFISYKCMDAGSVVIHAHDGFKSTKICSNCGAINDPGISKNYKCECCGLSIDRDLNAAINLRNYGYSYNI